MTISSVSVMWSRSTGSQASDDGQRFTANYSAAYQVVHTPDTTVPEILAADDGVTAVPQLGDLYPGSSAIYCTQVGPPERVGPIFSIVPVQYFGELAGTDPTEDPLNKEPEIVFQSRTSTEPIDTDINGFPFTNCNGELVNGLQDDIWDYALTVRRNYAEVSTYALRLYARSYSSDVFYDGWPAGTASLRDFTARPIFIGGVIAYYEVEAVILFREPYNTVPERAWWKRYRNEGYYERVGTKVELTGGGGVGATAYAITSSAGVITAIPVSFGGRGYSTAPTVSITSSTGGTGAAATATINSNGIVTGINVGSGGTGYKSKLVRAADSNKEPVSQPVLLKADGSREHDPNSAVWIERPSKRPMPYAALGLV